MNTSTRIYDSFKKNPNIGKAKALIEWLEGREVEFEKLRSEVDGQILANRTKREGAPPRLNENQKRVVAEYSADITQINSQLKAQIEKLDSVELIVSCVLGIEQQSLRLERAVVPNCHSEDRPLQEKLVAFKMENIRKIESFI